MKNSMIKISSLFLLLGILFSGVPESIRAVNTINTAEKIARSIGSIKDKKYLTVAFSRVRGDLSDETINELIDFTNISIVKARRFRVIDRSKLQMILKEQKYNLSDLVSPKMYKELGQLLGVDLFIYGRTYENELTLKAIDVETSAIVWGDHFQLQQSAGKGDSALMGQLAGEVVNSLRKDLKRLKTNRINQISFWNLQTEYDDAKVIDYLSVGLTMDGNFQVIDRENLELILKEQQLNLEVFIDEDKAKRMGELYGIDAFIYGKIFNRNNRLMASLKMMNIYNGVIEWADLIQLDKKPVLIVEGDLKTNVSQVKKPAPASMVYVPGGPFIKGSNTQGSNTNLPYWFPEHQVSLSDFFIDKYEVTNKEYEKFIQNHKIRRTPLNWYGGKIPPGKDNHPVVFVNWDDANRYCKKSGKRLPTESEWEKAFRGSAGNIFPWKGSKLYRSWVNVKESGINASVRVNEKNKDVSPYGAYHMAGNVREWVGTVFKAYPGTNLKSRKFKREMVIRGGSWALPAWAAKGWYRSSASRTSGSRDVGFRCAQSVK